MSDGNVTETVVVKRGRGRQKGSRSPNSLHSHILRAIAGQTNGLSKESILSAVTAQGYTSKKGNISNNTSTLISVMVKNGEIARLSRGLYAPTGTPIPAPIESTESAIVS